jgi:8-oxo-dGTP pyrophosphatase MutT (NUDIX family)
MDYTLKKDRLYQYNNALEWSGAVCFIFVQDSILLIQRSQSMPTHSGQVAFVGGHKLDNESNPIETVKREFSEETGLSADILNDLNILAPVKTSNSKSIYPVVGFVSQQKEVFLAALESNGEWDNAYLVPCSYIFNEKHWSRGLMVKETNQKNIYFCPIPSQRALIKEEMQSESIVLWGATAKILWNFFKIHIDDANFSSATNSTI